MTNHQSAFQRAPRPLILWGGVALVCVGVIGLAIFLYRVGDAIADAFERSAATGEAVPNMDGGLGVLLTAITGFFAMIIPWIWRVLGQRHVERMDQQARGTAPGVPFGQPSQSPTPSGGLVNDAAIQQDPSP